MNIKRPDQSEFAPFYAGYIGKVPDSGPAPLMREQIGTLEKLRSLPDDKANHHTQSGKWTVKEVIGHVADAERVFSYRLTRIARGDKTPLAGLRRKRLGEDGAAPEAPDRGRDRRDDRDPPRDADAGRFAGRADRFKRRPRQQQLGVGPRDLLDHGGPHQAPPRHPRRALRSLRLALLVPRSALREGGLRAGARRRDPHRALAHRFHLRPRERDREILSARPQREQVAIVRAVGIA